MKSNYICLFGVAILSSGCAELLDKDLLNSMLPTVSFSGLDVGYVDFEQVETDFVFDVQNPNPVGFSVDSFNYALSFSDINWANGNNPDGLILNPANSSELSLPVDIVFMDLYDMVQASRGADHLPFGVEGSFGILLDDSSIVLPASDGATTVSESDAGYVANIPYDAGGEFPALRKPDFGFQKIEVRNVSFDSASLDLVMDVNNEHASNLRFTRFDYNLDLGSGSVIQGVADGLDELIHGVDEGNQNRTLRIPIEVDTIAAASSLLGLLTGADQLNIGLDAVTDVDTPFGLVELALDEQGNVSIDMN